MKGLHKISDDLGADPQTPTFLRAGNYEVQYGLEQLLEKHLLFAVFLELHDPLEPHDPSAEG